MSLFPTHPLYTQCQRDWREYRLCYEGGRAYTNKYLHKHPKEPSANFNERLARAIHPNHVRAVIDTYSAYLYKAPITRTATSATLQAMWADMDLLGSPANEFFEQAAQLVQRGGRCAVVVDKLRPEGEVLTRGQEQDLGVRPYAYTVDTEDVLNWRCRRDGRLEWVVIRETVDADSDPMEASGGKQVERARVWYEDRWELWEARQDEDSDDGPSVVIVDSAEHPCGEVPVVFTFWGVRHGIELIGDSSVTDLAPMNRRLMNYVSLIDEQAYQSTFSIMAVPSSTYESLDKLNFSPSGVIEYHDDVSKPPHYLSPDVGQIAALRSEIDKTESTIRQLSGLGRMNDDMGYALSSGVALSYITMDKDALLAKFGQRMARMEAHIARLAQAWMGETLVDTAFAYPTSFDPADLESDLNAALKLSSLELSGRAKSAVDAAALRAFLASRVSPAELEEILQDLGASTGT